jgi:hypothetical protein
MAGSALPQSSTIRLAQLIVVIDMKTLSKRRWQSIAMVRPTEVAQC